MSAREINRTIRDAEKSGRYVYHFTPGSSKPPVRIVRARTRANWIEVLSLASGKWFPVVSGEAVESR